MNGDAHAKKLAREFMEDQKRILEEFGDSAIPSKYKDAIASAQKTFQVLCAKSSMPNKASRAKA